MTPEEEKNLVSAAEQVLKGKAEPTCVGFLLGALSQATTDPAKGCLFQLLETHLMHDKCYTLIENDALGTLALEMMVSKGFVRDYLCQRAKGDDRDEAALLLAKLVQTEHKGVLGTLADQDVSLLLADTASGKINRVLFQARKVFQKESVTQNEGEEKKEDDSARAKASTKSPKRSSAARGSSKKDQKAEQTSGSVQKKIAISKATSGKEEDKATAKLNATSSDSNAGESKVGTPSRASSRGSSKKETIAKGNPKQAEEGALSPKKGGKKGKKEADKSEENAAHTPPRTPAQSAKAKGTPSKKQEPKPNDESKNKAKTPPRPANRASKKKTDAAKTAGAEDEEVVAETPVASTSVASPKKETKGSKRKATTKAPSTTPKSKRKKTAGPILEWEGEPDETDIDFGPGWIKRKYRRTSGASKDHIDKYWYTPVNKYQLRSLVEVRRVLDAMKTCKDENEAFDNLGIKKKIMAS